MGGAIYAIMFADVVSPFTKECVMEQPDVRYASLSEKKLKKLKKLEKELSAWLLAVQPAVNLAELSEEQVGRIQALEEELGVVLLAYSGE
jgi:aryl-alcohol dehydrogenase-like predicted oxidoreductase